MTHPTPRRGFILAAIVHTAPFPRVRIAVDRCGICKGVGAHWLVTTTGRQGSRSRHRYPCTEPVALAALAHVAPR